MLTRLGRLLACIFGFHEWGEPQIGNALGRAYLHQGCLNCPKVRTGRAIIPPPPEPQQFKFISFAPTTGRAVGQ